MPTTRRTKKTLLSVVTNTGTYHYNAAELQEFADNPAQYECSDNLPRWIKYSDSDVDLRAVLANGVPVTTDVRGGLYANKSHSWR